MDGVRVGPKEFLKRYGQRTEGLLKLARKHPEQLSADEVHDLRVATRRVQVLCRLLPKEVRKTSGYDRFVAALRQVLKATSRVRDLDTLALTLKGARVVLPPEKAQALTRERAERLRRASPAIDGILGVSPPVVAKSKLDGKKISKRHGKRARRHAAALHGLLAEVLADESRADELHALRKEAKKLRYLLELSDGHSPDLELLVKWQEALGEIHDLDVAIDYLRRIRPGPPADTIARLKKGRSSKYEEFVRMNGSALTRN
jgi:CHAD domain-containing protein